MNIHVLAQQSQGDLNPVLLIIYLTIVVIIVASWWKIFTKSGQPGWGALIPIYNMYLILKIAGRPWWFLLLLLIPLVNIIAVLVMTHDSVKSFRKGLRWGWYSCRFIFTESLLSLTRRSKGQRSGRCAAKIRSKFYSHFSSPCSTDTVDVFSCIILSGYCWSRFLRRFSNDCWNIIIRIRTAWMPCIRYSANKISVFIV